MIYITGDLHGSIDKNKINSKKFSEQKRMTKSDYLIIAGDFGCIWDNSRQQKWLLKWIENKNFTTLFIDGNHENFDLLGQYPLIEWKGGKVHQISNSIYHLMRGQVFKIDNQKIFTFGGAESIDKEYRKESVSWWRQEIPTEKEFNEGMKNLQKHNRTVDFVISHTAPTNLTLQLDKEKSNDPTCAMLDHFEKTIKYHQWYFGHFHINKTIGKFSALYNHIEILSK